MTEYIKVKLEQGSEYENVSIWKNEYDKPENLMFKSMVFELDTTGLTPGKYQLSVWKNSNKKGEKSPSGSISLVRVVEEDGDGNTANSEDANETAFDF